MRADACPPAIADWFAAKGWAPRRHQLEMLAAARAGRDALLVAPTGAGKTLAGFLPSLAELIERPVDTLHTLYVSPLKALAIDVQRNLLTPIEEMGLDIRVETRTGDTPSDRKARQRVKPPQILLTTPESLSLLLSYPDSAGLFANLRTIVIDEVHAFATGKRGDLLSLCLARLSTLAPGDAAGGAVGDGRRSGRLSRLALVRWRHRCGGAGRGRGGGRGRDRDPAAAGARAVVRPFGPLCRAAGDEARSRRTARRSSSATRAAWPS